jgi:hypothetical protein
MRRFIRPSVVVALAIAVSALVGSGRNWGP